MDSYGHPQSTTSQIHILHVLMMHGDDIIISLLDQQLYVFLHKVMGMIGEEADDVVRILKEKASVAHMVICEAVVTAENDKVVQDWMKHLQSQVNIPVILVSPDSNTTRVLNCTSDTCRYTPIGHMQYAVEKNYYETDHADPQMNNLRSTSVAKVVDQVDVGTNVKEVITSLNEDATERKNISDSQVDMVSPNRPKKQRVIWTPALRKAFDDAVHKLGFENAVPKKILELMKWPGLTRENVASHLQKYRSNVQKQQNAVPMQQKESSFKRRKIASNNQTINYNTMTTTTDPSNLHGLHEPVILSTTPQLNIHRCDDPPSTRSFDNMIDDSYIHDDSINLICQSFCWDPPTDLQNCLNFEIENSQGGCDYESQRCFVPSDDQLFDRSMSYKVPQCNTSQDNNVCSNIRPYMDNWIAELQSNSNVGNNVAQHGDELGGSYNTFPYVPNNVDLARI